MERYGDLGGATPGERLVLAVLNFQRARASESAPDAVGFLERGLATGGCSASRSSTPPALSIC